MRSLLTLIEVLVSKPLSQIGDFHPGDFVHLKRLPALDPYSAISNLAVDLPQNENYADRAPEEDIKNLLKEMRIVRTGQHFGSSSLSPAFSVPLNAQNPYATFRSRTRITRASPAKSAVGKVFGLDRQREILKKLFASTLSHSQILSNFSVKPPRGALLYGPPGTGKTCLAYDLSLELGLNMFAIDGSEISSKYFGEAEMKVYCTFPFIRSFVCRFRMSLIKPNSPLRLLFLSMRLRHFALGAPL